MENTFIKIANTRVGKFFAIAIPIATLVTMVLMLRGEHREASKNTRPEIVELRCQNEVDPQDVRTLRPRLSWSLRDSDTGSAQQKAEIEVGSAPGTADMWHYELTGARAYIEYNEDDLGQELQFGKRYYWRVRAWDDNNDASLGWKEGLFALKAPEPKQIPEQNQPPEPFPVPTSSGVVPVVSQVEFESDLVELLETATLLEVQQGMKSAVKAGLRTHKQELRGLQILKEQHNRPAGKVDRLRAYTYELALVVTTATDKRLVTRWFRRQSQNPDETLLGLSHELLANLEKEFSGWF